MSDLDEVSKDIITDLFIPNKNRLALTTLLGTGFALSGFILQNLGTRELRFSASIAQLRYFYRKPEENGLATIWTSLFEKNTSMMGKSSLINTQSLTQIVTNITSPRTMELEFEDDKHGDVIITYGNKHTLYEHLVVNLVSTCYLANLSHVGQQLIESSTRHDCSLGRVRLKNDYFGRLASELEDCIQDDDLRLAAIIPAYLEKSIIPPDAPD